jgi:hypothetical protein
MTDILSTIGSWSILKWIVLVLIAGFIGQFGKMAAEAIALKIRERRGGKDTSSAALTESSVSTLSSTDQIPDKKLRKALAKAKKKEAKNKS